MYFRTMTFGYLKGENMYEIQDGFKAQFFGFFKIIFGCLAVAIFDRVHDVKAIHDLC